MHSDLPGCIVAIRHEKNFLQLVTRIRVQPTERIKAIDIVDLAHFQNDAT